MEVVLAEENKIRQGWSKIQIGSFAKIISGYAFKSNSFKEDGIPIIKISNIRDGYIDLKGCQFVEESFLNLDPKFHIGPDELLISLTGSHLSQPNSVVGRIAKTNKHFQKSLLNQRAGKVIILDASICNLNFLFYFMSQTEFKQKIALMAHGAASQANVSPNQIESIKIDLPPLPTQQKIAYILSAYDDLIENNTRRIAILEEMAQSIYREWFVNFRYPGHENVPLVNGIPEGWKIKIYTDYIDVLSGGTPKTSEPSYWNGTIPFFTPKDVEESFYIFDTERHITEVGLNKCNSKLYPEETIFITARGTVGKCIMPAFPMAMSQSNYALISKSFLSQYFIFMLTKNLVETLKRKATGAVFDTIIVNTFEQQKIIIPPVQLIKLFTEQVTPIFNQIKNLISKNNNLRQTRDILLPKLISGKLNISSIEIDVSESMI